jgi:hypothetical protein
MHANPVQRKLVQPPKDCPWSSWTHYTGKVESKIRIDSTRIRNENQAMAEKRQNPHP